MEPAGGSLPPRTTPGPPKAEPWGVGGGHRAVMGGGVPTFFAARPRPARGAEAGAGGGVAGGEVGAGAAQRAPLAIAAGGASCGRQGCGEPRGGSLGGCWDKITPLPPGGTHSAGSWGRGSPGRTCRSRPRASRTRRCGRSRAGRSPDPKILAGSPACTAALKRVGGDAIKDKDGVHSGVSPSPKDPLLTCPARQAVALPGDGVAAVRVGAVAALPAAGTKSPILGACEQGQNVGWWHRDPLRVALGTGHSPGRAGGSGGRASPGSSCRSRSGRCRWLRGRSRSSGCSRDPRCRGGTVLSSWDRASLWGVRKRGEVWGWGCDPPPMSPLWPPSRTHLPCRSRSRRWGSRRRRAGRSSAPSSSPQKCQGGTGRSSARPGGGRDRGRGGEKGRPPPEEMGAQGPPCSPLLAHRCWKQSE